MSGLESLDKDELKERMSQILLQLDTAYKEVGPILKRIGDLRSEADVIYQELTRRGILKVEDPGVETTDADKVSPT